LTTGLLAAVSAAVSAADLSFVTPDGLFRVPPVGGDRRPVLPDNPLAVNALAWSADGQRLAVVHNYGEVYRLDPENGTAAPVFASDCQRPPTIDLTWQTGSDTLVIKQVCPAAIAGTPGTVSLYLSRRGEPLTPLPPLPDTLESDLFVAPNGQGVAYVVNQHIFVDRLDGSRPQRLTQTPGVYGAAGSPLAWSPDGSRLAFYEGSYPFQRLNVVGIDGGDRRLLTPEANFQIYRSRLLWSPDGRYIAFYRPHNPPLSNQEVIALVNVNTGESQILTRPGFYDALSWAPDSQQLAFAAGIQAGQQTLFRLSLIDQAFTVLSDQSLQNVLESQWAPDGDWIAFTASPFDDPFGTQVLHRVRPDGSEFGALTGTDEYVYPFTWVPGAAQAQSPGGS
jgi:Tol biopolymer transport system component